LGSPNYFVGKVICISGAEGGRRAKIRLVGLLGEHKVCSKELLVFAGAFEKLQKGTINFVMSVSLSVRPSAWNNSASLDGFS
jgi:hypothetical protein